MRTDSDYIVFRCRTSRVCQHHQNIVHSRPIYEHTFCHCLQDGQVWISDLQMEWHNNSLEDVGNVQTVFLDSTPRAPRNFDLTVEDSGMHQTNMVCDVVTGLQEVLHQEQVPTENPTVIEAPVNHVANVVKTPSNSWSHSYSKCKQCAGNLYAICCRALECTSILWRLWSPQWTRKLLRPRRTRCATQRKLEIPRCWPCQQVSKKILLDPWKLCLSEQRL